MSQHIKLFAAKPDYEFGTQNQHGSSREPTPTSHPLLLYLSWDMDVRSCSSAHMHTIIVNSNEIG